MSFVSVDSLSTDRPFIVLNPSDNVVVARVALSAGLKSVAGNREIEVRQSIGPGHKVAIAEIPKGAAVFKYGENIGTASRDIHVGDLVHEHNLEFDLQDREFEFSTALNDLSDIPLLPERTFMGYPHPDGRAGTRNYVAIVGTVNCSAYAVQQVQDAFRNESFEGTGIDGVVCLPHQDGCGQGDGEDMQQLRRTLDGLADHPNVAAAVIVGLGCEVNQVGYYMRPEASGNGAAPRRGLTLQESGGTKNGVADSVKAVWELIEEVGGQQRVACPASNWSRRWSVAARTGFRGSPPTPASATSPIYWSSRAARSVLPKRRKSTAQSIC